MGFTRRLHTKHSKHDYTTLTCQYSVAYSHDYYTTGTIAPTAPVSIDRNHTRGPLRPGEPIKVLLSRDLLTTGS